MNTLAAVVVCCLLVGMGAARGAQTMTVGDLELEVQALAEDDFSTNLDRWIVEGNSEVWLEDGKLRIDTPERGYATVWHREPFEGDQLIRFSARVIPPRQASNVNFFFCASLPDGGDFFAPERSGQYPEYHEINNYTMTFTGRREGVAAAPGYMRLRKNPGFHKVAENTDIRADIETDYEIAILKVGDRIRVWVNGEVGVDWQDEPGAAHPGGYAGFRTFWSRLAIDRFASYRVLSHRQAAQ